MFNLDDEKIECTLGNKECWQGKKTYNVVISDVGIYLSLTLGTAEFKQLYYIIIFFPPLLKSFKVVQVISPFCPGDLIIGYFGTWVIEGGGAVILVVVIL